jgi:hypothetical protein
MALRRFALLPLPIDPLRFAVLTIGVAMTIVAACASMCVAVERTAESDRPPPHLLMIDGPVQAASLASVQPKGDLTFTIAGKQRQVAARDIVRWGAFRPLAGAEAILLEDGDVVCGRDATFDGAAALRSETAGEVRVAAAQVVALVLRLPSDSAERDRLMDELTGNTASASAAPHAAAGRIFLDNGDIVPAKLLSVTRDEVTAETTTGKLVLPRGKVRAITLARTAPAISENSLRATRLVIGLADGSRLTAATWSGDGAKLLLTTRSGLEMKTPVAQVCALQSLGGRAIYLSDLQASGFVHIPFLSTAWPLALDRSVGGGRLRAGGSEYVKGLGMHSAARATYALDRPYRRFAASVAVDERAGRRGSVQFRAYTDDGSGQWKLRWSSETIRGGEAPVAVEVDLTSAKRLSLVVDFADRADEWDRADWLDARLVE